MTTPYDTCKIVKALRVAFDDYEDIDDLVEIVGDANNKAYKTIFKNLVKYFENEDNEIDEDLVALWETLKTDNPKKSKDSDDESEEKVKTKSPKKSKNSEEKVKTKSPKKSKDSDDESEEKVKTKSPKKSKNFKKTFELDADIDSSEFPDIEFIEHFDKTQLFEIFGEDNLKEIEYEDDTYHEWTFTFEDKEFSIYSSELDDDMTWILAGNTKTKKIVKELYEVMKLNLE